MTGGHAERGGEVAERVVGDLGWPEGPTVLPDGGVVFVESYRSRLSVVRPGDEEARPYAVVSGAPNSCVLGEEGAVYVCQNGGTCGPWRAAEMTEPAIQRVNADGSVETLVTAIEGVPLNGPNDLVFDADGRLLFTDPGTYNTADPDPSYIFALEPDGATRVLIAFPEPVFPNGIAVEADGSVVWDESYTGRVRRRRPDGLIEDLGRLPGDPVPDGLAIGADGRLYVTDLKGQGIHVLQPDGTVDGFIAVGGAPTNCVFHGETLYVTDSGTLAASTEPFFGGALWRLHVAGGGRAVHRGSFAGGHGR